MIHPAAILRRARAAIALVLIGVTCWTLTGCSPRTVRVVAAAGDSIAVGYDSCGVLQPCHGWSYSTGYGAGVVSLSRRVATLNADKTQRFNDAAVGATMSSLDSQLAEAVHQRADVVTVMMGANDACAPDPTGMTPVADFRSSLRTALRTYFRGRPSGLLLVSSVPNLTRVWQLGRTNATAVWIWQTAHVCQAMLANPTSDAPADAARRRQVQQRVDAFNRVLRDECAAFRGCIWDDGAAARYPTSLDQLSRYDYFHPSQSGQQMLADQSWQRYLLVLGR